LPRLFLPIKTTFDAELHDGGSTSFTLVFLVVTSKAGSRNAGWFDVRCSKGYRRRERCLTHAANIFPGGYEFESGKPAIS